MNLIKVFSREKAGINDNIVVREIVFFVNIQFRFQPMDQCSLSNFKIITMPLDSSVFRSSPFPRNSLRDEFAEIEFSVLIIIDFWMVVKTRPWCLGKTDIANSVV